MSKVQNFAEIAPTLAFSEFDFYDLYRSTFENSELGRIKRLLPLREMAENLGKSHFAACFTRSILILKSAIKVIKVVGKNVMTH